jgi:hypothetical protein
MDLLIGFAAGVALGYFLPGPTNALVAWVKSLFSKE